MVFVVDTLAVWLCMCAYVLGDYGSTLLDAIVSIASSSDWIQMQIAAFFNHSFVLQKSTKAVTLIIFIFTSLQQYVDRSEYNS